MKVAPIYSAKQTDRKVYHDNDKCTERNNIEPPQRPPGDGQSATLQPLRRIKTDKASEKLWGLIGNKNDLPVRPRGLVVEHCPYPAQAGDLQSRAERERERPEPVLPFAGETDRGFGVGVPFAALAGLEGFDSALVQQFNGVSDAGI